MHVVLLKVFFSLHAGLPYYTQIYLKVNGTCLFRELRGIGNICLPGVGIIIRRHDISNISSNTLEITISKCSCLQVHLPPFKPSSQFDKVCLKEPYCLHLQLSSSDTPHLTRFEAKGQTSYVDLIKKLILADSFLDSFLSITISCQLKHWPCGEQPARCKKTSLAHFYKLPVLQHPFSPCLNLWRMV